MEPDPADAAFERWLTTLDHLTDSPDAARAWRERRYRFAHLLGNALVGPPDSTSPTTGPALYGVWLPWGLLYVGQTTEAERRLRDLAIGESHHLANTFPPETWVRVIVIAWPLLPAAADVLSRLDARTIGLALEHHLQSWASPLANSARRTSSGGWRIVDRGKSRSVGARAAEDVLPLFQEVERHWTTAALWEAGDEALHPAVRAIKPRSLLQIAGHQPGSEAQPI